MARTALLGAGALAGLATVSVLALSSGGPGHHVVVIVPDATNVVQGQEVRAAGQRVGDVASITSVDGGHAARLKLEIDGRAWPLRRGAKLALRWGGTVSYDNRYIALVPGPDGAPAYRDDATFPTGDFALPGEFDRLVTTFDANTRRHVRVFLDRGGVAMRTASPALQRTLQRAPSALEQTSAVVNDLTASRLNLTQLVRSTDDVAGSVRAADPDLGVLVRGAATTFQAAAGQAQNLQATLKALPPAFGTLRTTLNRADTTLMSADDVAARLAPGVTEVRRIAAPLNQALSRVRTVGPLATGTLSSLYHATPVLDQAVRRVTRMAPELESASKQAVPELNCIRPYSPEIANLISTWGSILGNSDGEDHYLRANVENIAVAPVNGSALTPAQAVAADPALRAALPMPPGYLAGQPWYLPECGAGKEAVDPANVSETGTKPPHANGAKP